MRRLVAALSVLLIVAASAIAVDDAAAHAGGGHVILRSGARAPTTPAAVDIKQVVAIITAAARRYGQSPAAMLAVARCESGLNPRAVNRVSGVAGLFQFTPRTWRTTPYAAQSVFDATANANAAAWMWSVGRRREWVC